MTKILIVTDCQSLEEERTGELFSGTQGWFIKSILRQVGVESPEVTFTHVFPFVPTSNSLHSLYTRNKSEAIPLYRQITKGKFLHVKHEHHIKHLESEIDRIKPNVIVALGDIPLWAVCKKAGIKKYRGTPLLDHRETYKVIPTYHPGAVLRQWQLRPIVMSDLAKAQRESAFSDLRRPRREIWCNPSLSDIEEFYHKYIVPAPMISTDIETKLETITEVGYAPDETRALVIPFFSREKPSGNYWLSTADELAAWSWVRRINTEKKFFGQNFAYDMQYFWAKIKIPCPNFIGDTMLMHHAMQPEMKKGLAFLGSIYTDEPSWKFMRTDHSTIKKED